MTVRHILVACLLLIWIDRVSHADAAGGAAGRTRGIAAIFADEHLQESVLSVSARAAAMPMEQRYLFLSKWVLPSELHESLRVQVDFTPTQPAPPVDRPVLPVGRRINSGGKLVSPILDLMDVATEAGKLEEVRQQVEQFKAENLLDQKNRLAMLSLILLKQQKLEEALNQIDLFCQLSAQKQPDDEKSRAAEAILYVSSLPFAEVIEVVGPTVDRVINQHRTNSVRSTWSRQVQSLRSLRLDAVGSTASVSTAQWGSFSTISGQTRGVGIPISKWLLKKGQADNIASHGDDYLFFAIPMRGNYQVECDVTAFNWSETRLLVGGKWVSPNYNYINYQIGNMRNQQQRLPIEPRLTKGDEKLHYRTEVRDGRVTTFTNGRVIHSEQLPENHDPWIAIRNGDIQEGTAWNVRVTGTPVIPKTIPLTLSSGITGWLPYYEDTMWQWTGIPSDGISGERDRAEATDSEDVSRTAATIALLPLMKTDHEQAIFYQRPMLEDGTIEYEFFYSEGKRTAHPVLDRLCFLMQPNGMTIHWLTDGLFDRTGLAPDNQTVELANRRGPKTLPLLANAWNRASVKLKGDVIDVTLNGQLVYQRALESTNQRHFGFFYFSDQSELMVRNVRWTGQWPRELMAVKDQELATEHAEFLDQNIAHLKASFEYDFVRQGLDEDRFSVVKGNAKENFKVTPEGLVAIRPSTGGYQHATVAPNLQVSGDFDVTVAYDNFQTAPMAGGSSSLILVALHDNATADECSVTRRHMIDAARNQQHIAQCVTVRKTPEGEKREHFVTKVMEERSGRLRLARRGSKVYYLSAEGDSPNFRLWGSRDFSTDPIAMGGIRLILQMHQQGQSSVVWKNMTVRAESFAGTAVNDVDPRLVVLNEQRTKLPVSVIYDFTKEPVDPNTLYRWMDLREWNADHKGLRIRAEGFDTWESAGISTLNPIEGDFDISAEIDVISLEKPRPNENTGIFLQLDSTDSLGTQVNEIFSLTDSGFSEVKSQLRQKAKNGQTNYQTVGSYNTKSVSGLRIARRGKRWTTIARMPESGNERIIAESDLSDAPIPGARLLLHTGGANLTSEILLKKLEIHAAEYQAVFKAPAFRRESKP